MCDMTDNGERKKSSVADAVSQITVKALQQYRSRHEEDGEPDEGPLVPQTDVPDVEDEEAVQTEVPKIYAVVDPTTTLLGNRGVEVAEDDVDSDEELDGENEMVVLDPDHVRRTLDREGINSSLNVLFRDLISHLCNEFKLPLQTS